MRKTTVLAALLFLLVPSAAFSDSFSIRLGYFMPRALTDSALANHPDSLWTIELDQMSFAASDFRGGLLGASYEYFLSRNLSLAFTLEGFSRSRRGAYVDYVQFELDEGDFAFPAELYDGAAIDHLFKVSSTPLMASLKFLPLGRKTRIIPFVGGGAGLYFWSVQMTLGQMINFYPTDEYGDPVEYYYPDPVYGDVLVYPVEPVNGRERGQTFGWHAFAGIQVPIGYRSTIELEARYHSVKATLRDWFEGFERFDLGGLALNVGFTFWF